MAKLHSPPFPLSTILSLFIFLCIVQELYAEGNIAIQNIDGKAKVQKIGSRRWEDLSKGEKLSDNDLIETSLSSRLRLTLSGCGIATVGYSSRVLVSFPGKNSLSSNCEASFSLLNGGIFIQASSPGHFSVVTGNAVAEIDSGALAVFLEAESGQTGLFVLSDTAVVRGIMQDKGRKLPAGRVSFVHSGAEPLSMVPLSLRHAATLKRVFGDSTVTNQLQASGVVPEDDKSIDNSIFFARSDTTEKIPPAMQSYPRQFSLNKIYGSILDDRKATDGPYSPNVEPSSITGKNLSLGLFGDAGLYNGRDFPALSLVPCWKNGLFEAAIRLQIAENNSSQWVTGVKSTAGILDKVDHVTIGSVNDSLYLKAGTLKDVTLGDGLIVSHFRNVNDYSIFHPLGLEGQAQFFGFNVKAFLADAADPTLGGICLSAGSPDYFLSAGWYFDGNQNAPPKDSSYESRRYPVRDSMLGPAAKAGIYEVDLGAYVEKNYAFSVELTAEFAQLFLNGVDQGFLLKIPALSIGWPHSILQAGFMVGSGRLISNEFDQFYYDRRSYFDLLNPRITVADSLPTQRQEGNAFVSYKTNISRGIDLDIGLAHDIYSQAVANLSVEKKMALDYSFNFRLSVDSNLISPFEYCSVYACQSHARLFYPCPGISSPPGIPRLGSK